MRGKALYIYIYIYIEIFLNYFSIKYIRVILQQQYKLLINFKGCELVENYVAQILTRT